MYLVQTRLKPEIARLPPSSFIMKGSESFYKSSRVLIGYKNFRNRNKSFFRATHQRGLHRTFTSELLPGACGQAD
jgi:hypothetical protein